MPNANANAKCQLNAKNLNIFLQQGVQLKCSIDKSTILLDFFATFCNKILLLECTFAYLQLTSWNKIVLLNLFLITYVELSILL